MEKREPFYIAAGDVSWWLHMYTYGWSMLTYGKTHNI